MINKNTKLIFGLIACVVLMIGISYASVPLYSLFCKATGFGGATRVASAQQAAAEQADKRSITVTFDSNVDPALPWDFVPEQRSVTVKIGEPVLIKYRATNKSSESVVGTATYNVQPEKAGAYFYKTQCFCFTKQALKPGQMTDMAVEFYVDPSIKDDRSMDDVQNITLSYTFFRAKDQKGVGIQHSAFRDSKRNIKNP